MPETGVPDSEKGVVWTEDAQALLKKVPFLYGRTLRKRPRNMPARILPGKWMPA